MTKADIRIPHRFLINKSLRKATDDLRMHIDHYQDEYSRTLERCKREFEAEKNAKIDEYDRFKAVLVTELTTDNKFFDTLIDDVLNYAETYFQQKCLKKLVAIKWAEIDAVKGEISFLQEQMEMIGNEIELLEERKTILTAQAKVDDMTELIALSCPELELSSESDALRFVDCVTDLIKDCDPDQWQKKTALIKLRSLLQERIEFRSELRYITWVIKQKKLLSSQLKSERNAAKAMSNSYYNEISELKTQISITDAAAMEKAKVVRDTWEIPIADITKRISDLETPELKEYRKIRKRLGELYKDKEYKEKLQQYEQLSKQVELEIAEKESEYAGRLSAASNQVAREQQKVRRAATAVEQSKRADKRIFIVKLFSESPEVKRAKATLEKSKAQLTDSQKALTSIEESRRSDLRAIEQQRGYKPTEYRPTDEEYDEIKPLMVRKKELAGLYDFESIERQLHSLYQERNHWFERRNMIFQLCKRNHVYLISDRNRGGNCDR